MQETVARLRTFLAALQERPDIQVTKLEIGDPAKPADLLAHPDMPEELRLFYNEMNGLHLKWSFVEGGGGADLEIMSIHEKRPRKWMMEYESELHFGKPYVSWVLALQMEYSYRMVRHLRRTTFEILFHGPDGGEEADKVSDSVQQLLELGMKNGFCDYWPSCFQPNPTLDYSMFEKAIRRFQGVEE